MFVLVELFLIPLKEVCGDYLDEGREMFSQLTFPKQLEIPVCADVMITSQGYLETSWETEQGKMEANTQVNLPPQSKLVGYITVQDIFLLGCWVTEWNFTRIE